MAAARRKTATADGDMFINATVESLREKIDRDENLPKKRRLKTSGDQLTVLQEAFEKNPKPSSAVRNELAERLGMSSRAVQVWFQNRRAKLKANGGVLPARPASAPRGASSSRPSTPGPTNAAGGTTTVVSNLFADLPKGQTPYQLNPDQLNEFVSDSDDDGSSIASSLFSASSVSTLGLSQLNLAVMAPRVGNLNGNSVYGNAAFTRSLPDLHSMKAKQKARLAGGLGGIGVAGLHGASHLHSAWDTGDDQSDISSLPGSPNPFRAQGIYPGVHLNVNVQKPLLDPPPSTSPAFNPSMFPAPATNNPIPSQPPSINSGQVATEEISTVAPEVRATRRHSLHAEFNVPGAGLPANVLLQLQNNHLALQQAQLQQQQQQQQQQQHQQHQQSAFPSTPATATGEFGSLWAQSPASFVNALHSPDVHALNYPPTSLQQPQLSQTPSSLQPQRTLSIVAPPLAPLNVKSLLAASPAAKPVQPPTALQLSDLLNPRGFSMSPHVMPIQNMPVPNMLVQSMPGNAPTLPPQQQQQLNAMNFGSGNILASAQSTPRSTTLEQALRSDLTFPESMVPYSVTDLMQVSLMGGMPMPGGVQDSPSPLNPQALLQASPIGDGGGGGAGMALGNATVASPPAMVAGHPGGPMNPALANALLHPSPAMQEELQKLINGVSPSSANQP
ncbi:hypothetical protein HDU96_010824 [Phlyctochytrium bullatum]|nr:hypothetical protein HDU96_010824 [Phlyctochytrium bullatum]